MPVMSMNSSSSPAATNTNQMIMAKFLGFLHQLTGGADDGSSMVDMLLRTWCDADGGDGGVERVMILAGNNRTFQCIAYTLIYG